MSLTVTLPHVPIAAGGAGGEAPVTGEAGTGVVGTAIIPSVLTFAEDTFITTPVLIDHSLSGEFRIEMDVATTQLQASDAGGLFHRATEMWLRFDTINRMDCKVDSLLKFTLTVPQDGNFRFIRWIKASTAPNCTIAVNLTSQFRDRGVNDNNSDVLIIGANSATSGGIKSLIGKIRDFKIWSDFAGNTLIHHWPINTEVGDGGNIPDIVGGEDATLTLGGGSWSIDWPT